jgi:hypothetical protein
MLLAMMRVVRHWQSGMPCLCRREIFRRVGLKQLLTVDTAKIIGLAVVIELSGGRRGIHLHFTDRIDHALSSIVFPIALHVDN